MAWQEPKCKHRRHAQSHKVVEHIFLLPKTFYRCYWDFSSWEEREEEVESVLPPLIPHAKGGGSFRRNPCKFPPFVTVHHKSSSNSEKLFPSGNRELSSITHYYLCNAIFLGVLLYTIISPLLISACVHGHGDLRIIRFRTAAFFIYRILHMSSFHARS